MLIHQCKDLQMALVMLSCNFNKNSYIFIMKRRFPVRQLKFTPQCFYPLILYTAWVQISTSSQEQIVKVLSMANMLNISSILTPNGIKGKPLLTLSRRYCLKYEYNQTNVSNSVRRKYQKIPCRLYDI